MSRLKLIIALVLAVLVLAGTVAAGAWTPVAAAVAPATVVAPPTTRPAPPGGDTYRWAASWDSLEVLTAPTVGALTENTSSFYNPAVCELAASCGSTRSWTARSEYQSAANFVRPTRCDLGDFFILNSSQTLRLYYECFNMPVAAGGIVRGAGAVYGLDPFLKGWVDTDRNWVKCQSSEWATTTTTRQWTIAGSVVVGATNNAADGRRAISSGEILAKSGAPTVSKSNCAFISEISMEVCFYTEERNGGNGVSGVGYVGPTPTTGGMICRQQVWSAERWFSHAALGAFDSIPDVSTICQSQTAHADCPYIVVPSTVDGSDFTSVCGAISPFVSPEGWDAFFNWVPAAIEYGVNHVGLFARCLFVPVNGIDRSYWVNNAWTASAFGILMDAMIGAAQDFSLGAGSVCGVVTGDSSIPMFEGFVLNTCEIPVAIANPIKTALTLMVLVPFCFWYAGSIINSIASLINRNTKSPVE